MEGDYEFDWMVTDNAGDSCMGCVFKWDFITVYHEQLNCANVWITREIHKYTNELGRDWIIKKSKDIKDYMEITIKCYIIVSKLVDITDQSLIRRCKYLALITITCISIGNLYFKYGEAELLPWWMIFIKIENLKLNILGCRIITLTCISIRNLYSKYWNAESFPRLG